MLVLTAGCSCSSSSGTDGGVDAGLDLGADLGVDEGLDGGLVDAAWPDGTAIRVSVEAHGPLGACLPWRAPVTPRTRGLPADSTPRVLWHRDLSADPLLAGTGAQFYGASVGPDGRVWSTGPLTGYPQVTAFSATGTVLYTSPSMSGSPGEEFVAATPVLGPDGSAFFVVWTLPPRSSRLIWIQPDNTLVELLRRPAGTAPPNPPTTVMSPDGSVYAIMSDSTVSRVCPLNRTVPWTLSAVGVGGRTVSPFRLIVGSDGRLIISWNGANVVSVVRPDGTLDAPLRSDDTSSSIEIIGGDSHQSLYGGNRGLPGTVFAVFADDAGAAVLPPQFAFGPAYLTPSGGVWELEAATPATRLWRRSGVAFDLPSAPVVFPQIAEDDSAIGPDLTGSRLRRVSPVDGSIVWEVTTPVSTAGGSGGFVLDVDGVVYAVTGSHMFAVQTDVLPAAGGCYFEACDSRRSGSMLGIGPAPARDGG